MFGKIRVKAYAKLNLCLDIVSVRDDGFHCIESIMQNISIADLITIKCTEKKDISVKCKNISIPLEKNIAYKAAVEFFKETGIENPGIDIKIEKYIPAQAGMGGGSADAAAVIVSLNDALEAGLSKEEMCKIAAKLGADVPFFISGGTQLVRGIGDVLTQLDITPNCAFVVVKGKKGISTKEAYADYDKAEHLRNLRVEKVIDALSDNNLEGLKGNLVNVFEQSTRVKEIHEITEKLKELGAVEAAMTGSGSAVFGIFESKKEANKCAKEIRSLYPYVAVAKPVDSAVVKCI